MLYTATGGAFSTERTHLNKDTSDSAPVTAHLQRHTFSCENNCQDLSLLLLLWNKTAPKCCRMPMEVCSKNPNRTAPDKRMELASSPFQMLAWLLYAYFAITGFGVFVPLLPPHWMPAGYICTGIMFACHLCVHVLAVSIDPADLNVRSRTHRGPVPVFDRSKHAHVIENCHCFLCQVDVGPKSKHCSACNKCVANFDHHCRWLNNCVGSRNYNLFLLSVASALFGVCLVLIVASYVFIEFFVDPSKLRTDKHFQVRNESAVWFLFLPVAPVVSAGAVIPGLAAVTIALGVLSCVLLCHLLFFHIYLMWNRLSTYEYIIRQRHRLNPRNTTKAPAKEPTVPSLNIIKEVSYSGTLGYTNTQMEVEEPSAITAKGDTECVANGRVRSASAPVVEEEVPPPAPTEVKAVTPQRRTQKRKKKVRKVPAEVTRERPLSAAAPPELTSTVSTVSLSQRLPFPSFPLRASLPPLASSPSPGPVMAAAPPSEYHSDSAESLEEIPVALAKLGSTSNRENSHLTHHRPTLSFPLPSPCPGLRGRRPRGPTGAAGTCEDGAKFQTLLFCWKRFEGQSTTEAEFKAVFNGTEAQELRADGPQCCRSSIMAKSSDVDDLLVAFRKFAVHGDHKGSAASEMPGQKWAKLCKDCKIIDGKHVTSTDTDIIFSKLIPKTARGMSYTDFKKALEMLAQKRFPEQSKEEALQSVYKLIEGKEPANAGVTKVDKTGQWTV
ncbi:hypothetical protein WMY93_010506 [Mugilogobius chulae]|uniref:Palmitoyltransferase n=1 Tax=Mugilogobius chulae TaxID=88201 RepID=A0AAW0P7D6_9GOBI